MVHLPYLQPFDDVNKCFSRLAANIPFIKGNLAPLSVFELNRTELLRDVVIWAYERPSARYTAIQQSLGEPDPFRLRYRDALRVLIGDIVRGRLDRATAPRHIDAWASGNIAEADRDAFRTAAEDELLSLHDGNSARRGLRPMEFGAWQAVWEPHRTHGTT